MERKHRAEVEVQGTERSYVLRLGTGAICHLEEKLNLDITELFQALNKGTVRLTMVREFVRASSVEKPDMSMTDDEANTIIDDCGVMPLLDAMTDSILATFNTKKDADEKNPQKAARGTKGAGSESSSAPRKRKSSGSASTTSGH